MKCKVIRSPGRVAWWVVLGSDESHPLAVRDRKFEAQEVCDSLNYTLKGM